MYAFICGFSPISDGVASKIPSIGGQFGPHWLRLQKKTNPSSIPFFKGAFWIITDHIE